MVKYVVVQWYYSIRDTIEPISELVSAIGPFPNRDSATDWVRGAITSSGWGYYEYEVTELVEIIKNPAG